MSHNYIASGEDDGEPNAQNNNNSVRPKIVPKDEGQWLDTRDDSSSNRFSGSNGNIVDTRVEKDGENQQQDNNLGPRNRGGSSMLEVTGDGDNDRKYNVGGRNRGGSHMVEPTGDGDNGNDENGHSLMGSLAEGLNYVNNQGKNKNNNNYSVDNVDSNATDDAINLVRRFLARGLNYYFNPGTGAQIAISQQLIDLIRAGWNNHEIRQALSVNQVPPAVTVQARNLNQNRNMMFNQPNNNQHGLVVNGQLQNNGNQFCNDMINLCCRY